MMDLLMSDDDEGSTCEEAVVDDVVMLDLTPDGGLRRIVNDLVSSLCCSPLQVLST